MSLEDAGFCKKGEIGAFFDSVDTTYQGSFPVNTDGGQISAGQPVGGAGGFRHVIEAARQINARLLPSYAYETSEASPNPVPTKCLLRVLGLPGGPCRPPMGPEPDGLADRAREVLDTLG